ncbi:nuclease-related domain-containing protein [Alkalicoccobacillus murimartini]|uniref:NERD domain-containing protein n=1 Tax=Alkalicoccobacillus murimartini TaxID=171685 RepID=A0ABT9YGN2_9BACI|nr:nuclease-related domain-containing protein [Alkalicoccobacillus murimartini]MDQ0207023.1 hypothetical protein [Alkalicoccobacillus murimartini]
MAIVKERTGPLRIAQLEALLRRLPSDHEKVPIIQRELVTRRIGYQGEKSLNYYFSFLSDENMYLLHDLRLLGTNGFHFQIDTLLITQSYIAIIEIKNYSGTIYFDPDTHQVFRTSATHDDEILTNPLSQIQIQKVQLKEWLTKQNWPLLPIVKMVVFSDPSTKIVSTPTNLKIINQVTTAPALLSKIEALQSKFSTSHLTKSSLQKLAYQLARSHIVHNPNILRDYNINERSIICGVYCPSCKKPTLLRGILIGKWFCPICQISSKHAHISALEDYYLLLNKSASSNEIHHFLRTSTRQQAYDLLKHFPLNRFGAYRSRRYELKYPLSLGGSNG